MHTQTNSTQQVLQGMFLENTGIAMMDSGGDYGRHWQKNQGVNFDTLKNTVTFEKYNDEIEIVVSISSYAFCEQNLQFEPKINTKFQKFLKKNDLNADLRGMEQWVESLEDATGIYGEGNPVTVNTYSEQTDLNQVLQYVAFEYNGQEYVILQVHNGADVRGGYTDAKIFSCRNGLDTFVSHGRHISVGCSEGHSWYKEDWNSWEQCNDEGKQLQEYCAEELKYDEDTKTAYCPVCMALNSKAHNPLQ